VVELDVSIEGFPLQVYAACDSSADTDFSLSLSKDAEAAQIIFDPEQVSYRQLLEFFYRTHDPTTLNRQGPDTGPQYRSAIYFHNDEQEKVAREVTRQANEQWWDNRIVTEIAPAGKWWTAEEYHQLYLQNNPHGYECPSHFLRNLPPLK
jgi:peptide-methionine (S)-S-oxide reductase